MHDEIDNTPDTENNVESDEQFDARMRAGMGLDDAAIGSAMQAVVGVGSEYHPTRVKGPELPPYFGRCTPASVSQAHEAVLHEIEKVDRLVTEIDALDAQGSAAEAEHHRAVRKAELDGTAPPKPFKPRDNTAAVADLKTRHAVRIEVYRGAVAALQQAIKNAGPAWLAALVSEQEPARQTAREALAPVEAAVRAIGELYGLHLATAHLWGELNPDGYGPDRPQVSPGALARGLAAARELLEDAALDGSWMKADIVPPKHVRKQWAQSGHVGALRQLLEIESAEDFQVTDYSKPWARNFGMLPVKTTPSGIRFVA